MNKIKFLLNIALVPLYFILLLVSGMQDVVRNACSEVADGYRATKRIYGIK